MLYIKNSQTVQVLGFSKRDCKLGYCFISHLVFREATSNFWKQSRRTTYGSWPFNESDKCSAERMAAAGFYVIGDSNEPDLVECFICSKQLDGWEPDDDPWYV